MSASRNSNLIGRTVSHYRILERLGGGGMGEVYKCEDLRLKRIVALTFLPETLTRDPLAKERFVLEAQTASSLDHRLSYVDVLVQGQGQDIQSIGHQLAHAGHIARRRCGASGSRAAAFPRVACV